MRRTGGATKTPHPIEWLSDNGSVCIAEETAQTAAALGLRLEFTPVHSLQSNGIAEAFAGALKRDCARLAILADAQTVRPPLQAWREDDNTIHPRSGLPALSPREFLGRSASTRADSLPVRSDSVPSSGWRAALLGCGPTSRLSQAFPSCSRGRCSRLVRGTVGV